MRRGTSVSRTLTLVTFFSIINRRPKIFAIFLDRRPSSADNKGIIALIRPAIDKFPRWGNESVASKKQEGGDECDEVES